jgi:hypothetical protein
MICIVDRNSTARSAVKLAQTAYICLLLPTRTRDGGLGARYLARADRADRRAFAHPCISANQYGASVPKGTVRPG